MKRKLISMIALTAIAGSIWAQTTNVTFSDGSGHANSITSVGIPDPGFSFLVGSNNSVAFSNVADGTMYNSGTNAPSPYFIGVMQTLPTPLNSATSSFPFMVQEKVVVYGGNTISFLPLALSTVSEDPLTGDVTNSNGVVTVKSTQSTLAVALSSTGNLGTITLNAGFKSTSPKSLTFCSSAITIPTSGPLFSVQKNPTFVVRLEMFDTNNGRLSVLDTLGNVQSSQCISNAGIPAGTIFKYLGVSNVSSGYWGRNFYGLISNVNYSKTLATTAPSVPAVTPASQTLCSNATPVPFVATSVAAATLTWSTGVTGNSFTPIVSSTITTQTTTTYTVSASICGSPSSSASVTLTVNPTPSSVVSGNNFSICSGSSVIIAPTPAPPVGTSSNSASWSPSTGLSKTLFGESASPSTNTTYTLTTTNSLTGCKSSNTVSVIVNPMPAPVSGIAKTVCNGSPVNLGSAGVSSDTYSWLPVQGLTSSAVPAPVATPSVTTTYTVTETTSAGCSKTATVTISVNPTPAIPTITGQNSVCVGAITELSVNATGGTWSIANPSLASIMTNTTGVNLFVTGLSKTTTADAISYTVGNSYGCTSSATLAMNVNDIPTPFTIAGTYTVCPGTTQTYTVTPNISANNYTWNIQDDPEIAEYFPVNGSYQTNLNIPQTNSKSNFTLRCVGTNQCGTYMAVQPITINSNVPPTPIITCSGTNCADLNVTNAGSNNILWSPSSDTTATITRQPATYYEVIYTNPTSGCTNYSYYSPEVVCTYKDAVYNPGTNVNSTYHVPTGLLPEDFNLSVYPNPSQGKIQFESNGYIGMGVIYDSMGNQVQTIPLGENSSHQEISLEGKAPGIYFLKMVGGAKQYSATFIIQ